MQSISSNFLQSLSLRRPIIQAPMAGGATTPELVAAVCNAGALGSLAAALLPPDAMLQAVEDIRRRTGRPFAVNLFVLPTPQPDQTEVMQALEWLKPHYEKWEIPPTVPEKWCENFDDQFEALIESKPAVASFAFDCIEATQIERLHQAGCLVLGTATTINEALIWQERGADAICVQGIEAGGHRGTFIGEAEKGMIGLMALLPQVVDAVKIPVIAAGGIMDGRGIAASLVLGAVAVQMGTAFLSCPEAAIHLEWKRLLACAHDDSTRLTRVFSGRYARGLENAFMREMAQYEHLLPPYPIQNALTAPLRRAAAQANCPDYLSLWAGQGVGLSRILPAAELVECLYQEYCSHLQEISGIFGK